MGDIMPVHVGDILSTVGSHDKCGGYLEYRGGVMINVGDILSTMGES